MVKVREMLDDDLTDDDILLEVRPSWWNFFWLLVFSPLIVPFIVAWVRRKSLTLRVYPNRLMLEKGLLSKYLLEIYIADIRALEIKQSLWQRMLNIGDINIDTAGPKDDELVANGIPNPRFFRELVQELRKQSPRKND